MVDKDITLKAVFWRDRGICHICGGQCSFDDFAIQEGTNYFTFNIPNSKCESCGHIVKAPIIKCPKCSGEDITQYTRVIGYLRPIKAFGFDRLIEAGKRVYSNKI